MAKTSRLSGFYKFSCEERLRLVEDFAGLTKEDAKLLTATGALSLEQADRMIENVIGVTQIPLGVATNFQINDKDYLIPMAIEEPSVVAAASNAAKMARKKGGFATNSTGPVMIGQVQAVDVPNPDRAKLEILMVKEEILEKGNSCDPILVRFGGGAKGLDTKVLDTPAGPMVITELHVDVRDAMGANAVNTMAEAIAPIVERITGGKVLLRIISNLATKRLARARCTVAKEEVGGESIVDGILKAYAFAMADPYRCATHNKGVMNGIVAVALATGQDTRALEAGAHAYAARSGQYSPLTSWAKNEEGDLVGSIELPLAVGTVGGITRVHPIAKVALKILGVSTAQELAEVMAAVGLAQNLAALRALVAEGIQAGHMRLHARNVAIMAGASGALIDEVAERMVKERMIRVDRAAKILKGIKEKE